MESLIQDYRTLDGINIAHSGRTSVSLVRYGGNSEGHSRTRMEESWTIEEVDFNIEGLSMDCFLPPADLKKGEEGGCGMLPSGNSTRLPFGVRSGCAKLSASKVVALDVDDSTDSTEGDGDDGDEEL